MGLKLGDLGKDRQLLRLLEAAMAHGGAARLRRDDDHRRMSPIGGGDGGHKIGDARAVLGDAHALAVADAAVAVCHVARALFMGNGNETDARRLEDVEGVHIGRSHDAEYMLHIMGDERLDEGFARCHVRHGDFLPIWQPLLRQVQGEADVLSAHADLAET